MSLLTELDALFAARLGRGAVREGLSDEGLCPLSAGGQRFACRGVPTGSPRAG